MSNAAPSGNGNQQKDENVREEFLGGGRVEAFSDGVIAIIITIMALELKAPDDTGVLGLRSIIPTFLGYLLSFLYLGIYWSNHHHLLKQVLRVDAATMWANLNLLFWLSLIPFVTAWAGKNPAAAVPTACYGVILVFCTISYAVLQRVILRHHEVDSPVAAQLRKNKKGTVSLAMYACAAGLAFVNAFIADAIYLGVALLWIVPDRRLEQVNPETAEE